MCLDGLCDGKMKTVAFSRIYCPLDQDFAPVSDCAGCLYGEVSEREVFCKISLEKVPISYFETSNEVGKYEMGDEP